MSVTGGGSNSSILKQLVEYITGMDTRIGYPNEHLAGDSDEAVASPLYATAVGLLMNAIQKKPMPETGGTTEGDSETEEASGHEQHAEKRSDTYEEARNKRRKSVFDKWSEKLKEFLDNAE